MITGIVVLLMIMYPINTIKVIAILVLSFSIGVAVWIGLLALAAASIALL